MLVAPQLRKSCSANCSASVSKGYRGSCGDVKRCSAILLRKSCSASVSKGLRPLLRISATLLRNISAKNIVHFSPLRNTKYRPSSESFFTPA